MLMNSLPAVILPLEDDRLALDQRVVTLASRYFRPNRVGEDRHVAEHLDSLVTRTAGPDAEPRRLPGLPLCLILRPAVEAPRGCVEDERCFRCEAREVAGGVLAAERCNNRVGRRANDRCRIERARVRSVGGLCGPRFLLFTGRERHKEWERR